MTGVLEVVAPRRLGPHFRLLLAASWLGYAGDGIAVAAGPLLVASLTHNAVLIASGATLQWLPPLLFGLWAGALSDRLDRRRIVLVTNLVRIAVLAVLVATIAGRVDSVPVVLGTLFALGTAEVFADNSTATYLPTLVARDDLALGNARMQFGVITLNQLAGPPVGAAIFTVGVAWPFATQVVLAVFATLLVARIELPPHGREHVTRTSVRADIAEGVRWLVRHPAVRTLALTILTFNVTFGAAWSVLVLYATHRLHLGAAGFGLITTVQACGGLLATGAYGWIVRHVSLGNIMRVGLVIETLTHLGLALATSPWVAMPIFFVFGAHAFVWGATSSAVRQRAVPRELQGRVTSVYLLCGYGGLVVGSGIGGVLARQVGITAPFWFAFVGSAVFLVLIWRQLVHIAHDSDVPDGRLSAR